MINIIKMNWIRGGLEEERRDKKAVQTVWGWVVNRLTLVNSTLDYWSVAFQQSLEYCRLCHCSNSKSCHQNLHACHKIDHSIWVGVLGRTWGLAGGKQDSMGLETLTAFYKNLSLSQDVKRTGWRIGVFFSTPSFETQTCSSDYF